VKIHMQSLRVNEIFKSIQGEGVRTGIPMLFIRLTGCNLRCSWCDTDYSFDRGDEMTIQELIEVARRSKLDWVCLTGGEPLLQDNANELIETLLNENFVQIFTNGTISLSKLLYRCEHNHARGELVFCVDIKLPSSKMFGRRYEIIRHNLKLLNSFDEIKFVIRDEQDFLTAEELVLHMHSVCPIIFTPEGGVEGKWLTEKVIARGLKDVRVMPQLHKLFQVK